MIHIFYNFQDGPWGGGNQFLKALRDILRAQKLYAETLEEARIVLVNSHHLGSVGDARRFFSFLKARPDVRVVHRIDGPVTLIRGMDEGTDSLIFRFNQLFAHRSIVQSHWCLDHCQRLGFSSDHPVKIIYNAPNPSLFYPEEGKTKPHHKVRLIATSWSANWRKGFAVYQWMDENLDWSRYEMSFIGNSPVEFENIKHIPPVESAKLGMHLRDHDIFVTASQTDPCSNSLIEALHCGLPALVLRDGGHPELVGDGGLVFDRAEEIPVLLDRLAGEWDIFRSRINLPSLNNVAESYSEFMLAGLDDKTDHMFSPEDGALFLRDYARYHKADTRGFLTRMVRKILQLFK